MRYEELKGNLTLCSGTRKGSADTCRGTLHRCGNCGTEGCKQSHADSCSNQAFNVLGHCLKCQATNRMETLAPGDYTPQQAWLAGTDSSSTH
ncbi:hypothetical protein [Methylotetracoccus oryzae]|uniref:hypothetical protein n=1 Tax=Methylotetracoccus oryzae TaxID=1919059 RepID=UPI0011196F4C|nr:hypothetical protein [Methylotetracoccus oryzae]